MTGSRRQFLIGAGTAAAAAAALAGPAEAARASHSASAARSGARVPLLLTRVADGQGASRAELARLVPGTPVTLSLAPTDYDGRAVEVVAGGSRVGFVPPRRAEALASLLEAGYQADGVVHEVRVGGPRPEVTVEVRLLA
jgi:hypothetical protein